MKISTEYLLITYYGDYTSKIIADWLAFYSKSVKIFYTDKFDIELKSILIGNVNSHLMSSQFSQFKSEKHYISFYRGGMVKLLKVILIKVGIQEINAIMLTIQMEEQTALRMFSF